MNDKVDKRVNVSHPKYWFNTFKTPVSRKKNYLETKISC